MCPPVPSPRVAELEAQLDALFCAVLAADEHAKHSVGLAMVAVPDAQWRAVLNAAGIPVRWNRSRR